MLYRTMKTKGLAMNYVVTAAILLVLFILIIVFVSNRFSILGNSETCKAKNGECKNTCDNDHLKIFTSDCGSGTSKSGPCCIPKSEVGF